MSLTDGRYEEKKVERMSIWMLLLGLSVPVSLIIVGFSGLDDRRWLAIPVVLLLIWRILSRRKRRKL